VEGVFAKKFSGAGEDFAVGLSRGSYASVRTRFSSGAPPTPSSPVIRLVGASLTKPNRLAASTR
jgi:hypothetical protein